MRDRNGSHSCELKLQTLSLIQPPSLSHTNANPKAVASARTRYLGLNKEFSSVDRNNDGKITKDEWVNRYGSEEGFESSSVDVGEFWRWREGTKGLSYHDHDSESAKSQYIAKCVAECVAECVAACVVECVVECLDELDEESLVLGYRSRYGLRVRIRITVE